MDAEPACVSKPCQDAPKLGGVNQATDLGPRLPPGQGCGTAPSLFDVAQRTQIGTLRNVAGKRTKKKPAAAKKKPKATEQALASDETTTSPAPTKKKPKLGCRFYKTDSGNEPVKDWLKELPAEVRKEVGSDIQVVQWRWPLGKPLVDGFGDGLFEVRTSLDGNIYRVLFCLEGSTMILLHGFMKKTQQTPKQDVGIARKRMSEE